MATVLDVLELIPEYQKLRPPAQNAACCEVEKILNKLAFKLAVSPYQPTHERDYTPNLNGNLIQGTRAWILSFPEQHRLGALAVLLSTIYVTQPEFDQLAENAISELSIHLFEMERRPAQWQWPVPAGLRERILPFPLDAFGAYERVIRRMQIPGTIDISGHGSRTTLADYVYALSFELRWIADQGEDVPYPDKTLPYVKSHAKQHLNRYVLVVADWSFSGTSLASELVRLLHLFRILYEPHMEVLSQKRRRAPSVLVFVPLITAEALDALNRRLRAAQLLGDVRIAKGTLETRLSLKQELPESVKPLSRIFAAGGFDLGQAIERTADYHYIRYGDVCWEKHRERHKVDSEWKWGYKGGGYAVVAYLNTPNNSIPLLWHTPQANTVGAPFPRDESRLVHASVMAHVDENLEVCLADEQGRLRKFLEKCYASDL